MPSDSQPQAHRAQVLIVRGGRRLSGAVTVSGFKHSLVTVLGAACASHAAVTIQNCPDIAEASVLAKVVNKLGGTAVHADDTLVIDASRISSTHLILPTANSVHGIVYLAPALLGRFGEATVSNNGGCRIGDLPLGDRPIAHYLKVFERFGATVCASSGQTFTVKAKRLHGCEIDLLEYTHDRALQTGPLYSGASKAALLTAVMAHGVTILRHLYPKPDVADLIEVLIKLGADIEILSDGSCVVHGRGPEVLDKPAQHILIPDLIEIVTWICAGALLSDDAFRIGRKGLMLQGLMPRAYAALNPELTAFSRMGMAIDLIGDEIVVQPVEMLRKTDHVITSAGVFSDSHPFITLLATYAPGLSTVTETVWANRFGYIQAMRALGAQLEQQGATVFIRGPCPPAVSGQSVHATDLRAAALLVLAALNIKGETIISGTEHLARGYADLPSALNRLGADISLQ